MKEQCRPWGIDLLALKLGVGIHRYFSRWKQLLLSVLETGLIALRLGVGSHLCLSQ